MQIPRSELRKDEVNDKVIECSWHKSISIPKRFIFGFFFFFFLQRDKINQKGDANSRQTSLNRRNQRTLFATVRRQRSLSQPRLPQCQDGGT
jgi:hypothetical protein